MEGLKYDWVLIKIETDEVLSVAPRHILHDEFLTKKFGYFHLDDTPGGWV